MKRLIRANDQGFDLAGVGKTYTLQDLKKLEDNFELFSNGAESIADMQESELLEFRRTAELANKLMAQIENGTFKFDNNPELNELVDKVHDPHNDFDGNGDVQNYVEDPTPENKKEAIAYFEYYVDENNMIIIAYNNKDRIEELTEAVENS